ncbi:MAG: amidohydrolase family protein [Ilumatobacteraceae bacterium]
MTIDHDTTTDHDGHPTARHIVDTVLAGATLVDGRSVDVHIAGGAIVAVVAPGSVVAVGAVIHQLEGRLLLPALTEPHAHLDKAFVASTTPNHTGDLDGAIAAMGAAMNGEWFTFDGLVSRASAALEMLIGNGVTLVRTHVNVGDGIGASYVEAVAAARAAYVGVIEVEIVSLTHTPLSGTAGAGNRAALVAALAAGADVVGACPSLDDDPLSCLAVVFDAAEEAGVAIDLHTDETLDAEMLTLRDMARMVQRRGFASRVAASHCVSLSMQPLEVQRSVAAEVAAAGIAVIPQPQTNLYLQGRGLATGVPRGLAPIDVLRDAGVLVAAGGDNVQDPFNPIGRGDPLETAALLVLAGHQLPDVAYRMVSNDAREALGRGRIEVRVGDVADLVAMPVGSAREAIAIAHRDRMVFKAGRLVASSVARTTIHR